MKNSFFKVVFLLLWVPLLIACDKCVYCDCSKTDPTICGLKSETMCRSEFEDKETYNKVIGTYEACGCECN